MDLQKLKYFHTAARLQNITASAEEIHIAQPSLSKAIHLLEEELGVPLFCKVGRRVELTEYGVHLKNRLDTLLPEIDGLKGELKQLGEKSALTVKINILAASHFVIGAIMRYRRTHPDVIFELEQNDTSQNCDIVITTNGREQERGQQRIRRCVKTERIYLAVPKDSPYASRTSVELAEMKDESFVMPVRCDMRAVMSECRLCAEDLL